MRLMADTGSGRISPDLCSDMQNEVQPCELFWVFQARLYFGAAVDLGGLELAAVSAKGATPSRLPLIIRKRR